MSISEINEQKDKKKIAFLKTQSEKNYYLGEYKERVIIVLKKNQLLDDFVYDEVLDKMSEKEAYMLKMLTEIPMKKLKPYILEAEKINLRYELVEGIEYYGDVGLVLVSKDALPQEIENPIVKDMEQEFEEAELGDLYKKTKFNNKICKKCYEKIEKKLPQYADEFRLINFIDKLLGEKCFGCSGKES